MEGGTPASIPHKENCPELRILNNDIYIDVWNGRAVVSKYNTTNGSTKRIAAANWEELEDEAIRAVEAQGGWVTASGHYGCPDSLKHKAIFVAFREE